MLEGVIAYAILTLATPNPPVNKPATIPLTVLLEDADQNLIVGPAPYQGGSVLLSSSDAENGQLSKPRLISPADATGLTVTYSGAAVAGNIRCNEPDD